MLAEEELKEKVEESSRELHERRLDELAWLLEGRGMCTAIATIDEYLVVSDNGFFEGTQQSNQQLKFICDFLNHFSILAKNKIPTDNKDLMNNREKLIKQAFKYKINTETKGGINIAENILETVTVNNALSLESQPELSEELQKYKDLAYLAFWYSKLIYNRIRKIENSIVKARGGNFDEITDEEFKAISNFYHNDQSNSSILFREEKPGVHAELQIMNFIVELLENGKELPNNIYIGISKLCCFHCHYMLEAANEVLGKEKGITLLFDGAHNASFKSNWIPPKGFELTVAEEDDEDLQKILSRAEKNDELTLKEQITLKYREKMLKHKPVQKYEQRHPRSSSEHSLDPTEQLERYCQKCKNDLAFFQKYGQGDSEPARMLAFALSLCDLERFKTLFDVISNKEVLTDAIDALCDDLKSKGVNINYNELTNFFKDPIYSPKEICDYFKSGILEIESNESRSDLNLKNTDKNKIEPKSDKLPEKSMLSMFEKTKSTDYQLNEYQKVQFITPWKGGYEVHSPGLSLKGASLYKDGKKVFPKK